MGKVVELGVVLEDVMVKVVVLEEDMVKELEVVLEEVLEKVVA